METAYFQASPEAVALIAPAVEARLAYRERIREVSKRIGATGTMAYDGDQVAYWILPYGAAIPEGWKSAPRTRNVGVVPDRKHAAGRAVWAEIGARPEMPCGPLGKHEVLCLPDGVMLTSGYGYERIQDTWIVTARLHEGRVVGGDPKGCRRIRNSEYWLLREAAEGAPSELGLLRQLERAVRRMLPHLTPGAGYGTPLGAALLIELKPALDDAQAALSALDKVRA